MARQPIYDSNRQLAGYELLYRNGRSDSAGEIGCEQSSRSLISSLIDIGLNVLSEDAPAYINIDEHLLHSEALYLLPTQKVVLELVESIEPTEEALKAIERLHRSGFRLALDDFEINPRTLPLIPYASVFKFDVAALGPHIVKHAIKVRKPGVKLLGEKIESQSTLHFCSRCGIELFQGYYFSKPEIVAGVSVPASKVAALQLASQLQAPGITVNEAERLISCDLALTYRLLRLIKSAETGLPEAAGTVRSAIMFLGMKTVTALASLLAFSATSNKPSELLTTALTRAKMCELLTPRNRNAEREQFFMAGLFSVLDALLNLPMADLIVQLPLIDEVAEALVNCHARTEIATALRTVIAFEEANWDVIDFGATQVDSAYYSAAQWAQKTARISQPDAEAA